MHITDVLACPVELTYKKPFRISGGVSTSVQHVLIQLVSDDGQSGFGEACPFPVHYADETCETVLVVVQKFLRTALIGKDPSDIEALESAMEEALPGHPLAKAGVDMAIYDLAAKVWGVPVYKLIGGKFHETLSLGWSIGIHSTTDEVVREAVHYADLGCPSIKLKIGAGPRIDLERLAAVREAVGPNVQLRVDANEGYRSSDALPTFRRMEKYDLEYIEQPVPRWDLDGMARLAAALDTPIMADESVFNPRDAMSLIRHRAADIFNFEPAKTGFTNSKRIAAMAEAAGLSCSVGSMLEGGLATAANLHFACATRAVSRPAELIGPLFFTDDVLEDPIFSTEPKGAVWRVPEGPGLGVRVAKKWLKTMVHVEATNAV